MPSRDMFETIKNKVFMGCQWIGAISGVTLSSCVIYTQRTQTNLQTTDGGIDRNKDVIILAKAGVLAGTLVTTPTDGLELCIMSGTDFAHTITCASGFLAGGSAGAKSTITFAAFAGASVLLKSYGSKWYVVAATGATIT